MGDGDPVCRRSVASEPFGGRAAGRWGWVAPLEGPGSAPGVFCLMWEQVWHNRGWESPWLCPRDHPRIQQGVLSGHGGDSHQETGTHQSCAGTTDVLRLSRAETQTWVLEFLNQRGHKAPINTHQPSRARLCARSCKLTPAVRGQGKRMHHPITSQLPLPGSIIPLVQAVSGREAPRLS